MYYFASYRGDCEALEVEFGSKKRVKELYRIFVSQFKEEAVMAYYKERAWCDTYEDILNDNIFMYRDGDGFDCQAHYTEIETSRWDSIIGWRKKIVRGLISFLKKYE